MQIRMTVADLIQELNKFPRDLPVLRADSDWGGIEIKTVEQAEFMQRPEGKAWVNYYAELDHEADEVYFKGVIIR